MGARRRGYRARSRAEGLSPNKHQGKRRRAYPVTPQRSEDGKKTRPQAKRRPSRRSGRLPSRRSGRRPLRLDLDKKKAATEVLSSITANLDRICPGDDPAPPTRWGLLLRLRTASGLTAYHPARIRSRSSRCAMAACRKGNDRGYGPLLQGLQGLRRSVVFQSVPT